MDNIEPLTKNEKFWIVAMICFVVLTLGLGYSGAFKMPALPDESSNRESDLTGTHSISANTLAASDLSNLYDAVRAGRVNDTAGLLALVADGRLVEINYGTQIFVIGQSGPKVSLVRIESGSAMGRTLYVPTNRFRAES